jgi:ABC-type transport system involved in multi-copper enzyme maturation permease subunit
MSVLTPYRSEQRSGGDGFAHLLRAEWTKFRTVRGWAIGLLVGVLFVIGLGALTGVSNQCGVPPTRSNPSGTCPTPPIGPGGEWVTDSFYLVGQPLAGNGSITVRVTSLTGLYTTAGAKASINHPTAGLAPGLQPWSKAGIIIKASTRVGSAYAAMMVTGSHGVQMQWNYVNDTPGLAGKVSAASPRWLRLTRSGDVIRGYDSADGTHWTLVGTATLAGLPATAPAGLFAASPEYTVTSTSLGESSGGGGSTLATAAFDHVSLRGTWPAGRWTGDAIGASGSAGANGGAPNPVTLPSAQSAGQGFTQAGGRFTVSGSGDIAPAVNAGDTVQNALAGTFAGLIAVVVIGVMFITAEYRRGLIRTTLAASPRRGRVLAAKAVVLAAVTFVAGLIAVAITIPLGEHLLRGNGNVIYPVSALTLLQVVVGTAGLLAVAAVLGLAVGTLLRRSAGAVTAVIAGIALPYLLAVIPGVLPTGAEEWLVRVTPAAAFAVQQSTPAYPQVTASYTPPDGYFPLAPWAGFAVLCAWAALALALAVFALRRRDV